MTLAVSVSIAASGNFFFILAAVIILVLFVLYIYKYTIPKVSRNLKIFLIILRTFILISILLLIFEPVITIVSTSKIESKSLIFIDNSNSIAAKDSLKRSELVRKFINDVKNNTRINSRIFSFGQKVDSLNGSSSDNISFNRTQTNFSNITEKIGKNSSANSAVILSDGIITDGIDPTYQAEKLQLPIFTVGIGDSTEKKDISIYNILYNQFVYAGKQTSIEADIKNTGFENNTSRISFFDEDKLLESKDITLSSSDLNKISFNYTPKGTGEKKLRISVTPLIGEATAVNNNRTFYLKILDTKLTICIVAGSPSADLSAVSKALSIDKNIKVKKLIQISSDKFWNDENISVIDSASILFLIGFPNSNTPQSLIEKVLNTISIQYKPFLFLLSNNISLDKLKFLDMPMPFSYNGIGNETILVQSALTDMFSSNFSTSENQKQIWNNLAPVTQPTVEFTAKPGSNVLVKSIVRNVPIASPLIVARSLGRQRSITILAGEIWRWQLQNAEKYPEFFDNFINDIVKWLNISSDQKQFTVSTDKNIYSPNEEINFISQLYDQTFTAIDTAHVQIHISKGDNKFDVDANSSGIGIYTSTFTADAGDYAYFATTQIGNAVLKTNTGRFTVGDVSVERLDTKMRPALLKTLASSSNGEYYSIDNYTKLLNKLADINTNAKKEYITNDEYRLSSYEMMPVIIIFLFTAEWFIRKRAGMI